MERLRDKQEGAQLVIREAIYVPGVRPREGAGLSKYLMTESMKVNQ